MVYRLSVQKIVEYLRFKVARLATPNILEVSRTLVRGLAKDGLMEDGKENLLQSKCSKCWQVLPHSNDPSGLYCLRLTCAIPTSKYTNCVICLIRVRGPFLELFAVEKPCSFSELHRYLKSTEEATINTANVRHVKEKIDIGKEEKKRKNAKASQGVEKLKKANVSGMAKLSSFFKKS